MAADRGGYELQIVGTHRCHVLVSQGRRPDFLISSQTFSPAVSLCVCFHVRQDINGLQSPPTCPPATMRHRKRLQLGKESPVLAQASANASLYGVSPGGPRDLTS